MCACVSICANECLHGDYVYIYIKKTPVDDIHLQLSCINPPGDAKWRVMICKRSAFFFINLARSPTRDNSRSSFPVGICGLGHLLENIRLKLLYFV